MRGLVKTSLILALAGLAGCQIPSRAAMDGEGGRTAYNVAIQMTNSQQMLLNLIRLRYADSPLFLDVSSITTQSTFRSEIDPTFFIPGFNKDNPFKLHGGIAWQDQPTITYTPLEGHAFAARLLRPIDLRTIQLLCYSGWDVDRIFRMMVQNFEDLSNTPDAAEMLHPHSHYTLFSEASRLLRHFQQRGELHMGVKVKECADPDPEESCMQISFPESTEESKRLAELLKCDEKKDGKYVKEFPLGFNNAGRVGVIPRSILSCMDYLSQGVQVPPEHIEAGMVRLPVCGTPDNLDWQALFCELLSVRSNRFPPKNAFVSVRYHNYWFYIDDCDLPSKKTFGLLLQLYNLNAIVPKNRGPILTLPLR